MKKKIGISIGGILVIAMLIIANIGKLTEVYIDKTEGTAKFTVEGKKAYMNGVISGSTISRVEALIKDHPEVKTIVMVNVPGSIDDESNLIASRLIRKAGLNTKVPENGMIASGGVDFFCAGVERTAHKSAEMGVHSWAGEGVNDATKLPKDHEEHKKYIEYYKEMGIPEDFYWFTIQVAPAESIHNMTQEERVQYKLIKES